MLNFPVIDKMETADVNQGLKHRTKGSYFISLQKNEEHQRPTKRTNDPEESFGCTPGLPKLPPKKNYIMVMDRSPISPIIKESRRKREITLMYVPKYKVHVNKMAERHPVLSGHPKFGSRHMVLGEKPVSEIYGTGKPSLEDLRKQEDKILGVLDFHYPPVKPDWKLGFKSKGVIYRETDPSFNGAYSDYKPLDSGETRGRSKTKYKGILKSAEDSYHTRYNEKYVYIPEKNGRYIERSFNPRSQNHSKHKGKVKFIEHSFKPHYHDKKPVQSYNKDIGHYDNFPFDPEEKFHVRHLPPIKQRGKYASVSSKIKSFDNAGYKPGGGHKFYPTHELKWNNGSYGGSPQFKSRSYPNTVNGSEDSYKLEQPEIQSQMEFGSVIEDEIQEHSECPSAVKSTDSKSETTKLSTPKTIVSGKFKIASRSNTAHTRNNTKVSVLHVKEGSPSVISQIRDYSHIKESMDVLDSPKGTRIRKHISEYEIKTTSEHNVEETREVKSNSSKDNAYSEVNHTPPVSNSTDYLPQTSDVRATSIGDNCLKHEEADDTNIDEEAITESDVASLPKSHIFNRQNKLGKSTPMNSKSPISKYQKVKMTESDELRRQNKLIESYRYAHGPRLRQARHTSNAKTVNISMT